MDQLKEIIHMVLENCSKAHRMNGMNTVLYL